MGKFIQQRFKIYSRNRNMGHYLAKIFKDNDKHLDTFNRLKEELIKLGVKYDDDLVNFYLTRKDNMDDIILSFYENGTIELYELYFDKNKRIIHTPSDGCIEKLDNLQNNLNYYYDRLISFAKESLRKKKIMENELRKLNIERTFE